MEKERSLGMSRPMRLLASIAGIGAMFALGRMARAALDKRTENSDVVVRPADAPTTERILIHIEPQRVYEHARQLEYFDCEMLDPTSARLVVAHEGKNLTFDLEVIADQPAEFFGMRVEHDGELYGTCLVRFEDVPGREPGTVVSISMKYKHEFSPDSMKTITSVVAREIDAYLHKLKDSCESEVIASSAL
jgi:hypothetical protein